MKVPCACLMCLQLTACVQNMRCEVLLSECERGLREAFEEIDHAPSREHCICLAELDDLDAGCE